MPLVPSTKKSSTYLGKTRYDLPSILGVGERVFYCNKLNVYGVPFFSPPAHARPGACSTLLLANICKKSGSFSTMDGSFTPRRRRSVLDCVAYP